MSPDRLHYLSDYVKQFKIYPVGNEETGFGMEDR